MSLDIIRNRTKITNTLKGRFIENRIIISDKATTNYSKLFNLALNKLSTHFKPKDYFFGITQYMRIDPLNRNHKIIITCYQIKD